MFKKTWIRPAFSTTSLLVLGSLANADVLTVDDSGGFDFTDIQPAIDAASDGDTIMVRPGTYLDFLIDNKSLNVFAETTNVNVAGTVYVSNLAAGKRVVLSGISVTARTVYPTSDLALAMNLNVGAIRIQNCTIKGGKGATLPPWIDCSSGESYGAGGLAADLFYCTDVAFASSSVLGGDGFGITSGQCLDSNGGNAGIGLKTRSSQVALYDCTVRGGKGGSIQDSRAGHGGTACHIPTGGVFASGTSFQGGNGGDTDYFSERIAGNGGHGVLVASGGNVHFLGCTHTGGSAGVNHFGGIAGVPGMGVTGTGIVEELTGTRRKCTAAPIAPPSSSLTVTIAGVSGDQVFLPWSPRSGWRYRAVHHGTWLIPYPARMTVQPIGVIPPSGTLVTKIPLLALPAGSEAELTSIQGFVIDTSGNAFLASPMQVVRR